MFDNIRVRFAPSPTGPLHIGGVRTALFNYLFARKHQGKMILRIEDTDRSRYVEGAEKYIMDALHWCGIELDEGIFEGGAFGPYRQSERTDRYHAFARELVEKGAAYYAFDTPDELEKARNDASSNGNTFVYNATTRTRMKNTLSLSIDEVDRLMSDNEPKVIRFKTNPGETLQIDDIIREKMNIATDVLDDKILMKADGMPTYHLANVVDDHLMEITHVIRGEEWLPSLPLHILLYKAFGWNPPEFAHLPLILKPQGKGKLSKRDGDKMGFPVFPLAWTSPGGETYTGYRESGYLPQAFINMLALLGWNPGDENEVFSMTTLIEQFSLEKVGKSGARFDPQKAIWFNHQHLQMIDNTELTELYVKELGKENISVSSNKAIKIVSLVKERVNFVSELVDETRFFFHSPEQYDEKTVRKKWNREVKEQIAGLIPLIEQITPFEADVLEEKIKNRMTEKQYAPGKIMNGLRLLLVGGPYGPHLFNIMEILGQQESLLRIRKGVDQLPVPG